ncbi:single-stranded DNA-binding protein [Savagea faecisuis]|uniref:Single-stranded DNA-binding protein n=1 Tax=Savagea faecisuis TaxID=1274803 RepID=A0ABW3GSY2_9BACL
MNQVNLVGRFVRDPEEKVTESGKQRATFTLAVPKAFKTASGQEADFIYCVAWGRQAELVTTYCEQGQLVAIVGRIQTRSYEREDGERRYVTEVVVERIHFLAKKSTSTQKTEQYEELDTSPQYVEPNTQLLF